MIKCSNGKFYIGQALDAEKKWKRHLQELKYGYHHNRHLQNIYDKYGEHNFNFVVVEKCNVSDLDRLEQKLLDAHCENPLCINISRDSKAPTRGRKMSVETCKKISASLKLRDPAIYKKISEKLTGVPRTEEDKQKMKKPKSEETKKRMSIYGKNRSENHRKKISENMLGDKNPNFGKRLGKATEFKPKEFKIMSPDGKVYEGINLTAFAKEHNLNQSCMINVNNGKAKSHKGWTKPKD
jgi:group I intron endonuclease